MYYADPYFGLKFFSNCGGKYLMYFKLINFLIGPIEIQI